MGNWLCAFTNPENAFLGLIREKIGFLKLRKTTNFASKTQFFPGSGLGKIFRIRECAQLIPLIKLPLKGFIFRMAVRHLQMGHLRTDIWRWNICRRTFADRHLRTDICGRNVWKIWIFWKIFKKLSASAKFSSANVRPQMSRPQVFHRRFMIVNSKVKWRL